MRSQTPAQTSKRDTWLQLLLAASIILYVYSPFLDHWLDRDIYSRPHTHIHLSVVDSPPHATSHDFAGGVALGEHDVHDENVLCLLNIDALLSLLLFLFIAPQTLIAAPDELAAGLASTCFDVAIIYISSPDPPPTV